MKFKSLLIGCLLISGAVSAQVASNSNDERKDFKPTGGSRSFEVNFSPFSGNPIGLSSNYLRGRYFISDYSAYRLGATLGFTSEDPNRSFNLGIAPGIEQHFAGTSRLSPYLGAELLLGVRSSSANWDEGSDSVKKTGAYRDNSNRSFFSFGLNGVIGCDYYFAKHIFLGFEAGYGINFVNYGQVQTTSGGGTPTVNLESESRFSIAPSVKNALRLGFVF